MCLSALGQPFRAECLICSAPRIIKSSSTDRETGSIKGHVINGATAYEVTIFIEESGGKTTLRVAVGNSLVGKFDFKTNGEISAEVVQETERQLGSRLTKI